MYSHPPAPQEGAGSAWHRDADFLSASGVKARPGRRLFRASHLGPLLPGGEIALTFQGCWLNPGSECLQGKHLLGGGGWRFCAHTPLPPPGPLLLTFKGASNFLSDQFMFEDSGLCPSSLALQTLLKNKTEQNLFNIASL